MKISIIIPNYNGCDLLEKNLPKIYKTFSDFKNLEVILVDDFSQVEDFKKLEKFIEKCNSFYSIKTKLIRHSKNLGFASACNTGIFNSSADIIVLLNSDVIPKDNFLKFVVEDFENDNQLFGVGFMDKSIEKGKTVLRGRGIGMWSHGFVVHARGEIDKITTLWVSGGSCALRRHMLQELKGFDSLYNPFYWEDIDLSYRAQKLGYHIIFDKRCEVVHEHEKGAIKKHYSPTQVKSIAYRNQFIFVWKNIDDMVYLFSHMIFLPIHLLKAIIRSDLAMLKGFFYAVSKFPAIIQKRMSLGHPVVADKVLLSRFSEEL